MYWIKEVQVSAPIEEWVKSDCTGLQRTDSEEWGKETVLGV